MLQKEDQECDEENENARSNFGLDPLILLKRNEYLSYAVNEKPLPNPKDEDIPRCSLVLMLESTRRDEAFESVFSSCFQEPHLTTKG